MEIHDFPSPEERHWANLRKACERALIGLGVPLTTRSETLDWLDTKRPCLYLSDLNLSLEVPSTVSEQDAASIRATLQEQCDRFAELMRKARLETATALLRLKLDEIKSRLLLTRRPGGV